MDRERGQRGHDLRRSAEHARRRVAGVLRGSGIFASGQGTTGGTVSRGTAPTWWSALDEAGVLPDRHGVAVVLVGDPDPQGRSAALGVPPLNAALRLNEAEAHDRLKLSGRVDVLVDACDDGGDRARRRWRELFGHVRRGGLYVIAGSETAAALREWATDLATLEGRRAAEGVRTSVAVGGVVALVQNYSLRLKVRDAEAAEVLAAREPALDVTELDTRPGGSFVSPARVTHHPAPPDGQWPSDVIDYPDLHLRRYEGAVAFHGGTLMHTGSSILPDSFRWHASDDPHNPKTENAGPNFARIPRARTIPNRSTLGAYYQLDPQYGGFGHVMTEVVGRLWGWDRAKAADPELKALFWVDHLTDYRNKPKYRVLRGWGIADADIVAVNRPTYVRSMTSGTVMWHNAAPFYVHPELRAVWSRLGDGLIEPDGPTADKIFVSRSGAYGRRSCHNAPAVEARFAAAGFTIVYPELLEFGAQVAMFRSARVVAGFGGSALFNIMFSERLERLIVLTHRGYFHRNEHLYTALLGSDVHYFWSPPDITEADTTDPYAAVESSWSFDFADLGSDLDTVLAEP